MVKNGKRYRHYFVILTACMMIIACTRQLSEITPNSQLTKRRIIEDLAICQ